MDMPRMTTFHNDTRKSVRVPHLPSASLRQYRSLGYLLVPRTLPKSYHYMNADDHFYSSVQFNLKLNILMS
jgi:hypothetical protein